MDLEICATLGKHMHGFVELLRSLLCGACDGLDRLLLSTHPAVVHSTLPLGIDLRLLLSSPHASPVCVQPNQYQPGGRLLWDKCTLLVLGSVLYLSLSSTRFTSPR
jgi:hypothetical protein